MEYNIASVVPNGTRFKSFDTPSTKPPALLLVVVVDDRSTIVHTIFATVADSKKDINPLALVRDAAVVGVVCFLLLVETNPGV